MTSPFEIVVPAGKSRERLDLYLLHHIENATRSKVQKAIREGYIRVGGKVVKPSYMVTAGESIRIELPVESAPDVLPEKIPLDIVFEDDYLLVINKPAGMVTHPAYANYSGTLVNALMHYSGERLSRRNIEAIASDFVRPGIVHRLDKDTSGLMVVAKDDATHANLAAQFARREIEREYWAIVWGLFTAPSGRSKGMSSPPYEGGETELSAASERRVPSPPYKEPVMSGAKEGENDWTTARAFSPPYEGGEDRTHANPEGVTPGEGKSANIPASRTPSGGSKGMSSPPYEGGETQNSRKRRAEALSPPYQEPVLSGAKEGEDNTRATPEGVEWYVIDAPLGRSKSDRKKIAVIDDGKRAVTEYAILKQFDYLSLVKCRLKTGRTHQIRVHMHHIGHPVFGDPTYGGRKISWGGIEKEKKQAVEQLLALLPRQALHAKTIGFIHPSTGKKLRFNSELPDDMKEALKFLV